MAILCLCYCVNAAADAYSPQALCHFGSGNFHRDVSLCTVALRSLRLSPVETADMYSNRAQAHYHLEAYAEAERDFSRALSLQDWLSTAYVGRGKTHWRQHNLDSAITDFDSAIRLFPRHALAYHYRGIVQLERRQLNDAAADFATAVGIADYNAESWSLLGIAQYLRGNDASARTAFDRAESLRYAWKYLVVWRWLAASHPSPARDQMIFNALEANAGDDRLTHLLRVLAGHADAADAVMQTVNVSDPGEDDLANGYYLALYLRENRQLAKSAALIEWLREQRRTRNIEALLARISPN